jgi:3-hydroxy acid dehydrogenase/malonic semialdehyde reductase
MEIHSADKPVAVVSGASCGFGEQIVRRLAGEGWLTIGLARRGDRLKTLADEVGGQFRNCDITDAEQLADATASILDEFPNVNLLVNNAGVPMRERFLGSTAEQRNRVMDVNYHGTIAVTEALLPGLSEAAKSEGGADIINIVSAAGSITNPNSGPYGASKFAQNCWSQALTADLKPDNIRVHTIHPGKAATEGFPQHKKSTLLKLMGTDVDAVAKVAVRQIGRKSNEVYVPRSLKVLAVAQRMMPVLITDLVDKAIK